MNNTLIKSVFNLILILLGIVFISKGVRYFRLFNDSEYAAKQKVETWNSRLNQYLNEENSIEYNESKSDDEIIDFPVIPDSFIEKPDTSKMIKESVACSQGYFGLISPEYILRIPEKIYSHSLEYREYLIGKNDFHCELLIFPDKNANLTNICADLLITNAPEPNRIIKSSMGKLKVLIGQPEELWEEIRYNAFIEIQSLKFIDEKNNNEIIEIKDKLLWKVLHLGVPG